MIVCGTGHYDCLSFLGGKLRQEGVTGGPTVQMPLSRRSGATTEGGGVLDPQASLPKVRSKGFIPTCTGGLWEPTKCASGQRNALLLIITDIH